MSLGNCWPAVVECGLCPMRRMRPRPMRWRGCARGSRSWRTLTRGSGGGTGRDELAAARLAARDAQVAALAAQVEELRRRLDKDSGTSSKPPSSDSPYRKPRDRSLRGTSGRKPGRQPGAESSTLRQSPYPDETVLCGPAACGCCGHGLDGEPVLGAPQKRQVFEASPPPPQAVTGARSPRAMPGVRGGLRRAGPARGNRPGAVRAAGARQDGPGGLRELPARRPRRPAGRRADRGERLGRVRGRHPGQGRPAADAVHGPGPGAAARRRVLCANETTPGPPGSCATCTWRAPSSSPPCTPVTGAARRSTPAASSPDIRAPSSATATGVRAPHRCAARLVQRAGLRDLAGLYHFDPDGQVWARSMADLLIDANAQATAARSARPGQPQRRGPRRHPVPYAAPSPRASPTTSTSAPRWPKTGCGWPAGSATTKHDPPLRHRPDHQIHLKYERTDVRRSRSSSAPSGGTWRTLLGLADFAIVQSYLSTTAKWGIDALDALTMLFTGGPWLPAVVAPP